MISSEIAAPFLSTHCLRNWLGGRIVETVKAAHRGDDDADRDQRAAQRRRDGELERHCLNLDQIVHHSVLRARGSDVFDEIICRIQRASEGRRFRTEAQGQGRPLGLC